MDSRLTYLTLTSAVFVLYFLVMTSAAQPNLCLLKCMRDVLKCKRDEGVGLPTILDCCEGYKLCYFTCEPEAPIEPSCSSAKGKRGSWNKRSANGFAGSWNKRNPLIDLEDLKEIVEDY